MVHSTVITVAAALLAALPAANAGLYTKNSPVVQLDSKSYDRLIAQSNYTSIVEFYAPWCGHCKNLQPAYEKAAKNLAGLAKVAAVDCDEESNKPFCGSMGVQGFPTLKIVRPGSKPGKPIVEDYQGPRTAKGIVDAVIDKIPNLVKKVEDKGLEAFLAEANDTAKAILFTDKGTTSALIKAVAIDFKGSINVAQIRNTQKGSVELFGITKYPTLLLLPGGKEAEGIVYDGELKKDAIVAFLSQITEPNPDPAPAKIKLPKSKDSKKASKAKESFKAASESQASAEGTAAAASATEETLDPEITESPSPEVDTENPIVIEHEPAPTIGLLPSEEALRYECLGPRTGTCILAILPKEPDELAITVVSALSEIQHRGKILKHNLFPFYAVPEHNTVYTSLKEQLGLTGKTNVIAINGRRAWYRKLPTTADEVTAKDVTEELLFDWIESIKLGEGIREKLPEGLVIQEPEPEVVEVVEEPTTEEAQEPLKEELPIEVKSEDFEEEPITRTEQADARTVTAKVEEVKVEETVVPEPHDEL